MWLYFVHAEESQSRGGGKLVHEMRFVPLFYSELCEKC